jgi:Ca2+-binding EF-hand superfamily protein
MDSIRKSVTLTTNVQTDIDSAKAIARKIFETYDRDRSTILENYEISPLLQDVYKSMNRSFTPSRLDVESYARVLDRNGDGKVSLQDVEALCIRYLVGEDALSRSQVANYGTSGSYLQGAGETVKRSAYGYDDNLRNSGVRTYDLSASGTQHGEYAKRAGNVSNVDVRASGTGQIRVLRRTQLEEARRIFDRFDADKSGYIDERELKTLLEETYKILGVNRIITQEDVTSYLRMVDSNKDGKVSPQEYEIIVIRSLERAGFVFE